LPDASVKLGARFGGSSVLARRLDVGQNRGTDFRSVVPYIAMNGQYFAWDRVRKNREGGIFEAIS